MTDAILHVVGTKIRDKVSGLLRPLSDGSGVTVRSVNNGLEGASIRKPRDDYHDQLDRLAKLFKHGPLPGTEGLLADLPVVTFSFLTIPDDRLGSSLSSCRAGFVLAEELRRICE